MPISQNQSDQEPKKIKLPNPEDFSGTPEQSWQAAKGSAAGPEANAHPGHPGHAAESTGRHATDEWKTHKSGGESGSRNDPNDRLSGRTK